MRTPGVRPLGAIVMRWFARLARAAQQHLVAVTPHVANAAVDRQRHAIDFRGEGLGEVGDAHGREIL